MKNLNQIRVMWKDLTNFSYSVGYEGKDIQGICATSIDEALAGCITGYCSNGQIDKNRINIIISCLNDIDRMLPQLTDRSKQYFQLLKEICIEIVKNSNQKK